MKTRTYISIGAVAAIAIVAAVWFVVSESGRDVPATAEAEMPRYRAAGLVIGVTTDPATPLVGENRLIVELQTPEGEPVTGISINAYAEMPAMGAMSAMRAPVDMREIAPGRYAGAFDLPMRGSWPITLSFETPDGRRVRLAFGLATGRKGLTLASGADPADAAAPVTDDAGTITVDSRRRQLIGVETGTVRRRNLVKRIRAVGEVTFDERLLSRVTLKFDGYIGDLRADYVGARVEQGDVLFTVYSPELLAAQREYLQALQRRGDVGDPLLQAARQRLLLWDLAAAQIDELERRGEPEAYVPIFAPRSGTVIERNVADGGAVRAGQTLLAIADLSRVWIETQVFEADLALVHEGMTATVTLPYLPGRRYTAAVEYVYPWLEGDSRTGRLRLSLDNPDGTLKPDMYAEAMLEADLGPALSVPEEAVIVAGDSRVVFMDLGGGRLKPVRIVAGRRADGFVEVLEGLSAGDTVVTSGTFLIAAEARLKTAFDQW